MDTPTRKFPRLCEACQNEEIRRAFACLDREKAATARGEKYECTCGTLECAHVDNVVDTWHSTR